MNATTISVNGDRQYVKDMRALANLQGETVGSLVRKALDAQYGSEIARLAQLKPLTSEATNAITEPAT